MLKNENPSGIALSPAMNGNQRSEAMDELISGRKGFLSNWALVLVFMILAVIVTATWFIKYPETIIVDATLVGTDAPKEVIIKEGGKVIKKFVNNEQYVRAGDVIAWIESTGDHSSVIRISKLLDSAILYLGENKYKGATSLFNRQFDNLGELQSGYQEFITALMSFNDCFVNGYYVNRHKMLKEELSSLNRKKDNLNEQERLLNVDLEITREGYIANNSLFEDKVISKQEFREHRSKLVQKQLSIPQMQSQLLENGSLSLSKQKELLELEHNISTQETTFQLAIQNFKNMVDSWLRKYVVTASIDGKISFITIFQDNLFVPTGKIIGYINPSNSEYYIQVILPQYSLSKVKAGQNVILHFDAYDYQEYGSVEGKVSYVSDVPDENGFMCSISLTKGLVSNTNRIIRYRSGLKSKALIVTEDLRLMQRFYYKILGQIQHD